MEAELSQKGVELEERDFFKEPFTEEELRRVMGDVSPSEVFSWRSPAFKKLGLDPKGLSDDELVRLMLEEPRLIRRPLVRIGDRLIVGGDRKAIEEALAG